MAKLARLTQAQICALEILNERPADTVGVFFGNPRLAAVCRRSLEPRGLVAIWRMADNCFRYSITDAGRTALSEREGE